MPAITTITDEARIVADNIYGAIAGGGVPTVRLGVTGLSRAGKTVFITALVHNLVHGGRLPLFKAYQRPARRGASSKPQPDDEVPRFDYEAHVRDLVERRVWPNSTRRISELRIVIEYESARYAEAARSAAAGSISTSSTIPASGCSTCALLRKATPNGRRGARAVARAAPRRRLPPDGMRRSPASTRQRPKTRRWRAGSPRPSPSICARRAPTSTRSRCCRPGAS